LGKGQEACLEMGSGEGRKHGPLPLPKLASLPLPFIPLWNIIIMSFFRVLLNLEE
jgi:hypothetical protein